MLLDTDTFTYGSFCAQTFLHGTFTHKRFYTHRLLHADALHADTFARKHFYIQTLLHTDAFTQRRFHTKKSERRRRGCCSHTHAHKGEGTYTHTHRHRPTHTHKETDTGHTNRHLDRHQDTHTHAHSQRSHRCRGHLSNPTGGWSLCHILGGHAFNVVQATEVCWDSSGSHTSSKVENQIVKLLTKVLSQAKNRLGPRQGGGTILSLQSIIGAGHNCIRIIKVWS